MTEIHRHSWQPMSGGRLQCRFKDCQTVSDIDTALSNAVGDAIRETKVAVLSAQLFAGELRKDAAERAYAWVKANTPDGTVIVPEDNQEKLL